MRGLLLLRQAGLKGLAWLAAVWGSKSCREGPGDGQRSGQDRWGAGIWSSLLPALHRQSRRVVESAVDASRSGSRAAWQVVIPGLPARPQPRQNWVGATHTTNSNIAYTSL